jgi:RNA polymerase sigma-70 factor, ECF subfamily
LELELMNHPPESERHEELRLLSAVLQGDAGAGRSFFERYNFTVERSVRRILRRQGRAISEEDVKDIVSEIWVSLLEDDKRPLRKFDPARDVRVTTWIALLARNKTIDHLRTTHLSLVSLEEDGSACETAAAAPLAVEMIEERERQELATRALKQLNAEDRHFLESWYVDACRPEDLALQLGISLGTVYSRRFKIQAKLTRSIRRLHRQRLLSRTIH